MKIILNNNEELFEQQVLTVKDLLEVKKFTFKMLVIKINNKIIKKDDYSSAVIKNGDNVIVLHLMSGG
jgi:sulfur carrier protein